MTKLIFKAAVLVMMALWMISSPAGNASSAAPATLACEPQSCKASCIQLGYATGICGVNGRCECLGHPVE